MFSFTSSSSIDVVRSRPGMRTKPFLQQPRVMLCYHAQAIFSNPPGNTFHYLRHNAAGVIFSKCNNEYLHHHQPLQTMTLYCYHMTKTTPTITTIVTASSTTPAIVISLLQQQPPLQSSSFTTSPATTITTAT